MSVEIRTHTEEQMTKLAAFKKAIDYLSMSNNAISDALFVPGKPPILFDTQTKKIVRGLAWGIYSDLRTSKSNPETKGLEEDMQEIINKSWKIPENKTP